jgi:hypothetical protein
LRIDPFSILASFESVIGIRVERASEACEPETERDFKSRPAGTKTATKSNPEKMEARFFQDI